MVKIKTMVIVIVVIVILLATVQWVSSQEVSDRFRISDVPHLQGYPAIAHNSTINQYLVVWEDWRGSGIGTDIYAQLVNNDGTLSGANFPLVTTDDWQRAPALAHNPATSKYLLVWEDHNNQDIYGQLVNANGSLSGSQFPIAVAAEYQWNPDLALNPSANQFLVVWQDDRLVPYVQDIYGQLVNADGSLSGANFVISAQTTEQVHPAVAYNTATNQYLVVWHDDTTRDIYAYRVNADGSLSGTDFAISTSSAEQRYPDLAYAASADRFLIVWEHNADIYGRLVNGDSSFAGPEFQIGSSSGVLSEPVVAFDTSNRQFLVVWRDSVGWDDLYARQVDTNGNMPGSQFDFVYATGDDVSPAIAFNSTSPQFLVAWQHQTCNDYGCDDYDKDIFGAFYQAFGEFRLYSPLLQRESQPIVMLTPTATATSPPAIQSPTPTHTATPTQTSVPGTWQTIMSEDFEGVFPDQWLVLDNQSGDEEYYWGKRDCRASSGSYSGWAVGAGTDGTILACGSNYPNFASSWMIYGPFSLADAIQAELSFKAWVNTESPTDMYDYLCWMASIDGINFSGDCAYGNSSGWFEQVLDLGNVSDLGNVTGQSDVWIGFLFASDSSVVYSEGAYIDDILLRKCVGGSCSTLASQLQGGAVPGLSQFPATKELNR